MIAEVKVGETKIASGSQATARGGVYSEVIVNDLGLGRYFEAARLGRLFTVTTAIGATLNGNAGAPGAAGTAVIAISNPLGNTKAAVILKANCTLVPGASYTGVTPIWWFVTTAGITAAGGAAAVSNLIGGPAVSSMKTYIAAALTGSVAATFLRGWHASGGQATDELTAAVGGTTVGSLLLCEETEGSIIVPPGFILGTNLNVAGAVVTGNIAIQYAEVDWPL